MRLVLVFSKFGWLTAAGAEKALFAAGLLTLVAGLVVAPGVAARGDGVDGGGCCCFWDLLPFFVGSFLIGQAAGAGGVATSGVSAGVGGSSPASFPLRFLPWRRHGCSGVARTLTSQGNLHDWK